MVLKAFAFRSFLFQLLLVLYCLFGDGSCREVIEKITADTFVDSSNQVSRLPTKDINNKHEHDEQQNDVDARRNKYFYPSYQNKYFYPSLNNKPDKQENDIHAYQEKYLYPSLENKYLYPSHSFIVFFTMNDLKVGKKFPLNPPHTGNPPNYQSYLPDSAQAKAILEEALKRCEAKPVKGETKFCSSTFESMLDFVRGIFESESSDFKLITSTNLKRSKTLIQNYTIIEAPKEIPTPKVVTCHLLAYPYALFYCHSLSDVKGFRISLAGDDNGDIIEATVVCHFDTSEWDPDQQAFKETGTKPGLSEICHFSPADDLVWVSMNA